MTTPSRPNPAEADRLLEAAALTFLLEEHPDQFTVDELVRELAGAHASFAERDGVLSAIASLERAGLLHQRGDVVFPSRAARRCYELVLR